MQWQSRSVAIARVDFPAFTGARVLMMPFQLRDPVATLPPTIAAYASAVGAIVAALPIRERGHGIAYLTIDEQFVEAGRAHRRPGLHVDGWAKDGVPNGGAWGRGGGGGWGGQSRPGTGFVMAASVTGAAAYLGEFDGEPAEFGDCEALREQTTRCYRLLLLPSLAYACDGLTVHESVPQGFAARRQFLRLSLPTAAAWPSSCTPNPLGVLPEGPIVGPRPEVFTHYGDRA